MQGKIVAMEYDKKRGTIEVTGEKNVHYTFYRNQHNKSAGKDDMVTFELTKSARGNTYAVHVQVINEENTGAPKGPKEHMSDAEKMQQRFLDEFVPQMEVDLVVNEKKQPNSWASFLYDNVTKKNVELRNVRSPFFMASKYKHGEITYDPAYTVFLNKTEYEYKREPGGNPDMYWLVDWEKVDYHDKHVEKVTGVWRISWKQLTDLIQNEQVCVYTKRLKSGQLIQKYMLDLKDDAFERVYPRQEVQEPLPCITDIMTVTAELEAAARMDAKEKAATKVYLTRHNRNYDKFTVTENDSYLGDVSEKAVVQFMQKRYGDRFQVQGWSSQFDLDRIRKAVRENDSTSSELDYVSSYFYDKYDLELVEKSTGKKILLDVKTAESQTGEPKTWWNFMYPKIQVERSGKDAAILCYYVKRENAAQVVLVGYMSEEEICKNSIIPAGTKSKFGTVSQIDNYDTKVSEYKSLDIMIQKYFA